MKENTHRYDDIMDLAYPLQGEHKSTHPKMTMEDRAKIFSPFAALRGYEDAIIAKQKIVVERIELTEEAKEILDYELHQIAEQLDQGLQPMVRVVYFQKDSDSKKDSDSETESGDYIEFTGRVVKLNPTARILQVVDKKLKLDDIYFIGESQ